MVKNRLDIALLGASGVGKTSLLAVMHHMFGVTANLTDLTLIAEAEGEAILINHYNSLKLLVESFSSVGSKGVKPTQTPQDFEFELCRKKFLGNRQSLNLKFIDVPGGYLSNRAMPDKHNDYINIVANAGATIIVVDTIALMHARGRFNQQFNQVGEVSDLIKEAFDKSSTESKLLIFVPIKCETALQEGKDPQELHDALKSAYDNLLRGYLLPKALNVAVVVAPVKTVGSVIFNGWIPDAFGGIQEWDLRKISADAPMNTEYADQPLRFLLRFLLCQYLNGEKGKLLGKFNDFIGKNEDLRESTRKFAAMRPGNDVPVEILQGHHLLNCLK